MNIFIVPSWYPDKANPIAGIFFKEQAAYIAQLYKEANIGVSLWGQSDPNLQISVKKILKIRDTFHYYLTLNSKDTKFQENLVEYYTPVLTWSDKILNGNLKGVLKANSSNLEKFEQQFGKIDLIHAHVSYPAGYIAMTLADKRDVPFIITEHMGPFPFKRFLSKKGKISYKVKDPMGRADKVIAVSSKLSIDIQKFNLPKPLVIPNVINEDFFSVQYDPKRNLDSPFRFFTLATLSQEKGIDDLLNAIFIVTKEKKDLVFYLGGGGEMLEYYINKSKELGLEENVRWLGPLSREESREQFRSCDAFVLASHHESFGVVYVEALACGKPILATRCGGPESIVNEKNGLLANIGDPEDLAEKMIEIIANHGRYDGFEIREDFEKRFSKNAVIPQIIGIYKSLIDRGENY